MNRKVNILYDASSLLPHFMNGGGRGIFVTALEILYELQKRKSFNIELYYSPNMTTIASKSLKMAPKGIKNLKLFDGNLSKYDVFISPMYATPLCLQNQENIQKYTIIYDIIPHIIYKYRIDNAHQWYFDMFNSITKDDYYFAISENTKNDFIKFNPNVTNDNTTVIPLAVDKRFKKTTKLLKQTLQKYNLPIDKKYIFSLCTLEPRKNLIRAVKTFIKFIMKNNIDDMVFILGGGQSSYFIKELEKEVSNFEEYKDKIIKTGYIDQDDLSTFYSGAEWFVFTSEYEGFGLPPLEAMACGCPVITSNNSSLPEVIKDAGIMIDWDNDEQHVTAYEQYYFNDNYRRQMATKGLKHVKQFSWKKTVDIMEDVIKQNYHTKEKQKNCINNKNKPNLLFDANILANAKHKNTLRSGVFFVVYNVLSQLIKQNNFNIYLYVTDNMYTQDNKRKLILELCENIQEFRNLKIATAANFKDMDVFLSMHGDIPDEVLKFGHIRNYKITYDFMGHIFDDKIFSTKLINHQKAVFTCYKQFCISESTKRDYLKFVPEIKSDKLIVTHLGAADYFSPKINKDIEKVKNKLNITGKYILSLCNLAPHKNLFTAIDAFIDFIRENNIHDLSYVLCGGIPKFYQQNVEEKLDSLGKYKEKIVLLGYVDDEDIPALYSGAEWFVFPSLYEGFGLPILEAMQCGTPVVCSNTSSMPEILGDCGLLVSPENTKEFVKAFKTFYEDADFRTQCSKAGLERCQKFSWQNMTSIISDTILADLSQKTQVMPIVLITDENYVKPTIVTITSLLRNKYKNSEYKIFVLGNLLTDKSKQLLKKMETVELIEINQVFEEFEGTHQHVSASALLKFKIAEILSQYDKALYLDTDMIVQHDLSELFSIDLGDKYAAVVKDMLGTIGVLAHQSLGLKNYFNSGMMLLNLSKLRNDNIFHKLLDYKLNKDDKRFMDQDCFNAVFNEQVHYISYSYNYIMVNQLHYSIDKISEFYSIPQQMISNFEKLACIIHFASKWKPWDYSNVHGSELWAKYYYLSPLKGKILKYITTPKKHRSIKEILGGFISIKKSKTKKEYNIFGIRFRFKRRITNKLIKFSKLHNDDFDMKGLSVAESWGRWSDGSTSTLKLPLNNTRGDVMLEFEINPFLHSSHEEQQVEVFANDIKVADWHFVLNKPAPETKFIIPESIKSKNKKVLLRFMYKNAISPKKLGISNDGRNLAIGIISMKITCIK